MHMRTTYRSESIIRQSHVFRRQPGTLQVQGGPRYLPQAGILPDHSTVLATPVVTLAATPVVTLASKIIVRLSRDMTEWSKDAGLPKTQFGTKRSAGWVWL